MTATTSTRQAPASRRSTLRVTQGRVIRSEWIKLRSLRSTALTLLTAVVLLVGLGLLFSWGEESHLAEQSPAERLRFDPTLTSQRGMFLAQLAVGVLGVLVVTGEYGTGMIRASLTAVPKRLPVLWAKALVFTAVAFIVMLVAAAAAFFGGQAILATQHIGVPLSAPGVARGVLGTALYLALVGLFGVALGTIVRNTAGAIAVVFGVLLVLPIHGAVLPSSWGDHINRYLPSNAGQAIMAVRRDTSLLRPWSGLGLFALYIALTLGAAAVLLVRRDT